MKFFHSKHKRSPSFLICEYLCSTGAKEQEATAMALSRPPDIQWDRTAPIPYGEAS